MRYRGNAKISVSTDVLTKVCDIKGLLLKRNIEKLGVAWERGYFSHQFETVIVILTR